MAGDDPYAAVKSFVDPRQDAVSCISNSVINVVGGYHPCPDTEPTHVAILGRGGSIRIGGDNPHYIKVAIHYRLVQIGKDDPRGHWKVRTTDYL